MVIKKTTIVTGCVAVLALFNGSPAHAQTAKAAEEPAVFLDVNVGLEGRPGSLATGSTFALFGETGSAATRMQPGNGGMLDLRVGVRALDRFGVAIAVSGSQTDAVGEATASIPSPVRFASPTIVTLETQGLKRRELSAHLQAVWFLPVSDKVNVSLFGGPSLVRLQQAIPLVSIASGAQTASVTAANESGVGLAGNVGFDISAPVGGHFGVGLVLRYVTGHVDLPSMAGVDVGGLQGGVGIRLNF